MNEQEFVYKDYLPANARVIVDYSKGQRVGFSYPLEWTYWKAVWKRAYPTIGGFWLLLHLTPLFYLTPFLLVGFILSSIFFPFSITSVVGTSTFHFDFLHVGLPYIGGLAYLMGIPALITLLLGLDKERMSAWLPKIGYWSSWLIRGTKEKIFVGVDVIDNMCVIPNFSNVFLNYVASGDFNSYLDKVEILEIPFSYNLRNEWIPFLKKKVKNDFEFRAVFYFSQAPKEGSLNVEFM